MRFGLENIGTIPPEVVLVRRAMNSAGDVELRLCDG
jgi:hypothetical protein